MGPKGTRRQIASVGWNGEEKAGICRYCVSLVAEMGDSELGVRELGVRAGGQSWGSVLAW
jgi:hypothetical protein